jgi:hypothetical protein
VTHDPAAEDRDNPCWNKRDADDLLGSLVLVGITYLDPAGEFVSKDQFFGHITSVDRRLGIQVKLAGERYGEVETLPPDTEAWRRAGAGHYRLRTTGEVVIDPDFTSSWSITPPKN